RSFPGSLPTRVSSGVKRTASGRISPIQKFLITGYLSYQRKLLAKGQGVGAQRVIIMKPSLFSGTRTPRRSLVTSTSREGSGISLPLPIATGQVLPKPELPTNVTRKEREQIIMETKKREERLPLLAVIRSSISIFSWEEMQRVSVCRVTNLE